MQADPTHLLHLLNGACLTAQLLLLLGGARLQIPQLLLEGSSPVAIQTIGGAELLHPGTQRCDAFVEGRILRFLLLGHGMDREGARCSMIIKHILEKERSHPGLGRFST